MKQLFIVILIACIIVKRTNAQNTFPSTGNVGIGTLSPATSLHVIGMSRFGSTANYVQIDASGNLSFTGTSGYRVGGNKYAFQFAGNTNYGLFFNSTSSQYEFRNASAAPVFYVNANSGNGVFNGTLRVGAYTLPAIDGSNGQVLSTNGTGTVSWSTISSGGGANTALSNLAGTSINQSLIPLNDSAIDLGSKIKAWRNIYADGKVGIDVDPIAKLDIRAASSGSLTTSLRITSLLPLGLINTLFTVRDDGRVGIGTASPTVALDVAGDALFTTTNTNCELRQKTSVTDMGWFAYGTSNKMGLFNYANSKTLIKILGTGEVSIGGEPELGPELSVDATRGDSKNLTNDLRIYTNQKYWDFSTYIFEDVTDDLWLLSEDGGGGWFDYSTGLYITGIGKAGSSSKKISSILAKISKIQPEIVNYTLANRERNSYSFDVKELEKIFPDIVYSSTNPKTQKITYGINYNELNVIAIKAIQEQQQLLDGVLKQNEMLQAKNAELEQRLSKLEAFMNSQQTVSFTTPQNNAVINVASLEQNIPNPFNNTTTINYTLPQTFTNAKILVKDKTGKLVNSLNVSGSGKGRVSIDATVFASGVYSYSLYVNDKLVATKQVILIK